ncbi:porin [Cognatishimia maritima]|uniref:Outer membrane protein OmpU n=1 Tax=Cognatishimia maritima TaxID=870908 RepID=A0A1M5SZX9_9RHOB|nr:porin [Cognatishimia maritima]SHH44026.1 outer membrane protein OmpU [Cognatishimia maritima]
MKKVLFASTALVLSAGVAAADVVVTGEANMGLKYDGTDTTVHNEIDFNIVGSGETDGGLTFGASVDLDASSDDSVNTTGSVADPEVFIAYNGLTLTVGDVGEANDRGGLADLGYDGIGIDNVAEINNYGSHDVRVDYAFGDIKVAVSMDSSMSDEWAIGASASFDAFSVDVGFGETGGANDTNITLGYSAGAFGAKIFFADNDTITGQGVEVSYTSGDVTVTGVYADNEGAADAAYGVGVAYDLGGATLAGGIGEAGGNTVADLGISFSF